MTVYGIEEFGGYYLSAGFCENWRLTREIVYMSKEKAYQQILDDIKGGDFVDRYGDPIILQDNEMPTIDELSKGWGIKDCTEYNGYRIVSMEVIE